MSGLVGFTATFLYFYVIFGEASARISLQTADKDVSSIDFATIKTVGTSRDITIINTNESIPVTCFNEDHIPVLIKSENSQYSVDIRCVKKRSVAAHALTPNFEDITNNNKQKFICKSNSDSETKLYAVKTNNGEQIITICFDPNKLSPKWARHILRHTNENNGKKQWEFIDTYMECGNCLYKYGNVYLQNKLQKGIKYQRGHLCPAGDFHEDEKKRSTYVLINTVPMWDKLNCGIWREIEKLIREKVKKSNGEFEIYTGAFSVRTEAEDPVIVLDKGFGILENVITIPQYIWKIVIYKDGNKKEGVVFVGINDPNHKKPTSTPTPPPTVDNSCRKCENYHNLIYCCEVESFLNLEEETWPIEKGENYEYLDILPSRKRPTRPPNGDDNSSSSKKPKHLTNYDLDNYYYKPFSDEDVNCDENDEMIDCDS